MSALPDGFYFSRYSKTIQCTVCSSPWLKPTELQPCGHVFCYNCVATCDACPACRAPIDAFVEPTKALVELVNEVFVLCEHCDWAGKRTEVPKHMCRGRQKALCIRAITRDAVNPSAWFGLGMALTATDSCAIREKHLTKVECYLQGLHCAQDNATGWTNLGFAMGDTQTVEFDGKQLTKADCYIRALELQPRYEGAWFNLGNSMRRGDVQYVAGEAVYKDTCYLRAVEINEHFAQAWYNLGLTLDPEMVIDYGSHELSAKDCFLRAVQANDKFADAWYRLGMETRKTVKFRSTTLTKKEVFVNAIQLKQNHAFPSAWHALGTTLKVDEFATIGTTNYTKEECLKMGRGHHRTSSSEGSRTSSSSRSSARKKKSGCSVM